MWFWWKSILSILSTEKALKRTFDDGKAVMKHHGCELEEIEKDVYCYYYGTKNEHSAWVTIKRTETAQWYYTRLNDISVSEEFQSLQECIDNAYADMSSAKL